MNKRLAWGTDLQLLASLQVQHDRSTHDLAAQDGDLASYSGQDNLIQALLLRFMTRVGELAALGHPHYGSRLHELLGEPNTETTRHRARLFVLLALQAEPRVESVTDVSVSPHPAHPLGIEIAVAVVAGARNLNLVFPFYLEGG